MGTGITLYEATGVIDYAAPQTLLQTLRASARFENLAYTFNPDLPPIRSSHADLAFENGILNIFPIDATYEGQNTGRSWLNIDFNPSDPLLNAYFDADLQLNDAMLTLLKRYRIALPFKQTGGTTRMLLNLHLNLNTESASAQGRFTAEHAEFSFKATPFNANGLDVTLDDANVDINTLRLSYHDDVVADVTGSIDAASDSGVLRIQAHKIRFAGFELDTVHSPLSLQYDINTSGDRVHAASSLWHYGDWPIRLGAFDAPFDFNALKTTLPSIPLSVEGITSGRISGTVDASAPDLNLSLALESFRYGKLALEQPGAVLNIAYHDTLQAALVSETQWLLDQQPLQIKDLKIAADAAALRFSSEGLQLNGSELQRISGDYGYEEHNGTVTLENLRVVHTGNSPIIALTEPVRGVYAFHGERFVLDLPQAALAMEHTPDLAVIRCNDLSLLAAYSPMMQDFNVSGGTLQVNAELNASRYRLDGRIDFPYPFIVNADGPLEEYPFHGIYHDGLLEAEVAGTKITLADDVRIVADHIGFNLGAILRFINDHTAIEAATPAQLPQIHLLATDSFIYLTPQRRALADRIELSSDANGMTIGMQHAEGIATFDMNPELEFHLYGHGFNDRFMNALLPLSKFNEGQLAFIMNGHVSKFNGIIQIKKTIMKDYKLLNNVLAFINTVPSLITFRLPDYNTRGLKTKELYTAFVYERGDITLDAAYLNAKEMDIFGKGTMNILENRIDVQMTLKTDIGSQLSKIPLVGYIILGDDGSVSTTLEVTGKLDDPEVENALAKDIVNAPLNIIKRTLMTPFRIFEKKAE